MTVGTHPDTPPALSIEQLAVNTILTLSIDAVQAANSGHPGTPMALAPVTYKLWQDYLRFDPELPVWANRDRFVLSVGHASALLYAMLHLGGVSRSTPTTRSSANRRFRWRTCADSGSWTPNAPGTPSTAGPPASSAPPARWEPGSPPASAWPSPDCGRPPPSTGPATSCSTTTCTRCAATAASWRASAPKPPHWPDT